MQQLTTGAREWAGTFAGTPRQVAYARHAVKGILAGCPRADDAALIVSELAANAILHSHSKDQSFTVRAEIHSGYLRIEVEDLGGSWNAKPGGPGRPHGLEVIEALTGPDNWGVEGDQAGRVVWCRLELQAPR
jgi:anti-sigma regulatory factor (Ser/Thr protein kinase)